MNSNNDHTKSHTPNKMHTGTTSSKSNEHNETNKIFQDKLQNLLNLVSGTMGTSQSQQRGRVVDDTKVEEAVQSILSDIQHNPTCSTTKMTSHYYHPHTRAHLNVSNNEFDTIIEDYGDYDDVDIECNNDNTRTEANHNSSLSSQLPPSNHNSSSISSSSPQQKQPTILKKDHWTQFDFIPLGRVGARMMITFGDGPQPNPDACQEALLATRQCLQNAIKDARALRRKLKQDFAKAKVIANLHQSRRKQRESLEYVGNNYAANKNNSNISDDFIDDEMVFKAMSGYDKISYEPQCGFDDSQLEILFPEEMNAYQRWKKMHKDYTDSKEDKKDRNDIKESSNIKNQKLGSQGDDDDDDENIDNDDDDHATASKDKTQQQEQNQEKEILCGGHLHERLAQFDARTENMKDAWYLAFAEVRQGSFLSQSSWSQESREWEKARKQRKREQRGYGKRNSTAWEFLPASYVQFLHWVGFDQRSALPPPKMETAEALAFLGYDFMGKIVEKAIFLKRLNQMKESNAMNPPIDNKEKLILQLSSEEQLTKDDIIRALQDTTVMNKPLYNASTTTTTTITTSTKSNMQDSSNVLASSATQLYFGPGFERRIEMELDQIVMGKKRDKFLSKEEKETRLKEDELFEHLKKPPSVLEGVLDVLGDEFEKTDAMLENREQEKLKQRKKDEERSRALMNVINGESQNNEDDMNVGEGSKKRKRGRPSKK